MKQQVKLLKNLPVIELLGRGLGPLKQGNEAELEAWEAAVLERHGFAEPAQKITPLELRKLTLAEERETKPAPLPVDFYLRIFQKVSSLIAVGNHEEAKEILAKMRVLVELRISKLIRLAPSPESAGELPPEEKFLINRLATVLDGWKKLLSEFFEKAGEEVGKNEQGGPLRHAAGSEADIQKSGVPAPELHTGGTASQE